ncbi:MAG TPA: hypothetical protein VKI61_01490 [Chitinophagaceae bacterium]|jgi:hypothetical protein|nr:hypothetical protein [Chitinophagaceae bacterium]
MSNFISLDQAIALTKNYRDAKEAILIPELRNKGILPICETFDADAFETLFNQNGCVSIRVYLGMDDKQLIRIIAVGANAAGEDMLPNAGMVAMDAGASIVEDGMRCPDICPPPSPINHG